MGNIKGALIVIGAIIGSLLLIAAVAIFFGLLAFPLANINRAVVTHQQAYVQTHQTMMLDYYADWKSGDAAHKSAAITQVCTQSVLLDRNEWPAQMIVFIDANCQ